MRKKFSFVSGDIHADRTLALAPFAGKTQIKRMLDVVVMPSVANDVALGHLPEQMRAPASRVLLLASDAKAGAHDSAVILPALPHADAPQRSLGQTPMIFWKLKMSFRFPRMIVSTQPKIFIKPIRLDHFAGIHLPLRIPESLELAKSLHKFRPKHSRKKFGARLPVPVLPREGASKADNQVSRLFHKLAVLADPGLRLQIKINASMNASVPEMPVERPPIPVVGHQFFLAGVDSHQVFPARRTNPPTPPKPPAPQERAR